MNPLILILLIVGSLIGSSGCTQAEMAKLRAEAQKENCAKDRGVSSSELHARITTNRDLSQPLLITYGDEILVNECKNVYKVDFEVQNSELFISSKIGSIDPNQTLNISESDCKPTSSPQLLFSTNLAHPVGVFTQKVISTPTCSASAAQHQIEGEM